MHWLHCHVNGHRLCQWADLPRRQSQARSGRCGQVPLSCVTCRRAPHSMWSRAHKQAARSSTEISNFKVVLRKQKDKQSTYKASWQMLCHISSTDGRLREQPLQKAALAAIVSHPFSAAHSGFFTPKKTHIQEWEALEAPAHSVCSPRLPADLRPQARQASRPGAGWTGKAKSARAAKQGLPGWLLAQYHPSLHRPMALVKS